MGAPEGNKNAEKWTLAESIKLFNKAIEKANEKETVKLKKGDFEIEVEQYKYDFIGELARDLGYYKSLFTDILKRYPKDLQPLHTQIIETCEANCFRNSKKGAIREATAIVNLKSNHNWTDRQQLDIPDFKNIKGITFNE